MGKHHKNIVKRKMEIGKNYYNNLKRNKNLQILPPSNSSSKNIYWVVGIVIKNKKIKAKELAIKLIKYGIGTRPFFWPMHEQTIFKKMKLFKREKYPNSSYMSRYGLYLPSYFELSKKQISYISSIVNKLI